MFFKEWLRLHELSHLGAGIVNQNSLTNGPGLNVRGARNKYSGDNTPVADSGIDPEEIFFGDQAEKDTEVDREKEHPDKFIRSLDRKLREKKKKLINTSNTLGGK